ncbi:MAG: NAD(P)/FAD-dependent oxidoreductase [Chthoniobacterales bacterium]
MISSPRAPGASSPSQPILVVGAGLAGLTCAKSLADSGQHVLVLEASDRPGGRVVSSEITEGFILDRGFQVLLDSYPTARRHLDFSALGGGRFRAGALFVGHGRPQVLENPLRNPWSVFAAYRSRLMSFPDKARLVLMAARALLHANRHAGSEQSTASLLAASGFSEAFMENFAAPFFGGVLLDPGLGASSSLFLSYLRRFVTGRTILPGEGIGAIPRQLASALPAGALRLSSPVGSIAVRDNHVEGIALVSGQFLPSRAVVLAVEEPALCKLLGSGTPRAARSTAVHYFAADRAWYRGAWLCLPPRREGSAVLHAALVSNTAPTLAPSGQHLWSATVLLDHPQSSDADLVAREIAGWFGENPAALRHLGFITVPYAVPDQPPGFATRLLPWPVLPSGVFIAGDAVAGASIDAAMASGEAVAKNLVPSSPDN